MDNSELIRIKSELICNGIIHNECSDKVYYLEHKAKVKRTSNMGLQLFLNNDILVSIPYDEVNENSKYYLVESDNNTFYLTDGIYKINVTLSNVVNFKCYDYLLENGKRISEYIQKEGRNVLICSVSSSCCYFSKNEQCAFCALNRGINTDEKDRIKMIEEAFKIILKEDDTIKSINLTGGNLYTEDRGLYQYIKIIRAIRSVSNIPIVVEASPPKDLVLLNVIKNEGATAVEFNVEIWDEKIRKMIMPGKANIKREHYVESWKKAVELFGKGNVGSGIIIGFEDLKSSLEGIKTMIEVRMLTFNNSF